MSTVQLATLSRSTIADPVVRQFVDTTADLMKWEVIQALSAQRDPAAIPVRLAPLSVGHTPKQAPSVGDVVTRWYTKQPAAKRKVILTNALSPATITPRLKAVGRDMNIDLKSSKYVLAQVDVKVAYPFFDRGFGDRLVDRIRDLLDEIEHANGSGGSIVTNRGLKFELEEVKCIDETDPEFFGKDTIAMGGTAVDDAETVTTINQFTVGDFDDGDVKSYAPRRELKSFSLGNGAYPKTFAIFLSIAEKDAGGFSDFLRELYEAIKAEVVVILTALGAAAGAAIGAAIGGTIGTTIGGPIGTIIGVVAGLILGALVGFLVEVLRDDIFEPQVATVTLPAQDSTFEGGGLLSPALSFVYEDHGGKYRVRYRWRIVR
ncbi:MAG: hypothetical protein U0556_16830 [Dehalococcoidia bacterium]